MSSLNLVKIFIEIFCSLAQIIFMGFIILMIIEIDKIIRFHFNAMSYYSMQNYIILKLNNAFSYIYNVIHHSIVDNNSMKCFVPAEHYAWW